MSGSPSFKIAKNAYHYIKEASFDGDFYAEYLSKRHIPEEEFARLQVTIDDEYMLLGAHGVYIARDNNDRDSRHIIGLSPSRMPNSISKQGNSLRHETEHFIYQIHRPNHLRNRKILVAGAVAIGGCVGTALGIQAGIDTSRTLPLAAELPIDAMAGITGAALGSLAAFVSAATAHAAFGPSEIQAEWAEHRRKVELPDGTLEVEFAH